MQIIFKDDKNEQSMIERLMYDQNSYFEEHEMNELQRNYTRTIDAIFTDKKYKMTFKEILNMVCLESENGLEPFI